MMVRNAEYQKAPFEERYQIVRELGSGHFAVVRHCVEKSTGNAFAAKFIRRRRQKFSRRGAAAEDIENEISLLFSLKHEHIISLHEVYEDDNHVILVLELVSGGELFHYLSERDHLSEEDASKFVQQLLFGLDHLHVHNIAHLDLKPENILLSSAESQIIKIIDFGLAKKIDPGGKEIKCMMGTAEFVAPEVVNYEPLSLQSDMWSVGVITYMLLSGSSPFMGQDQQETFANITRAEFDFVEDVFSTTSDLAKDFIRKLLVRDPKKRFTARQALEHPWIRPRNPLQAVKRKASAINMTRLKAFSAKRRWQKSLRVIKLCNRLSKGNRPASTASLLSTDASSNETLDMPENFVTRAIFCAVEDGNRQGLERLLGMATVDLESANEMGVTAAHVAAGAGKLQILQFLHITYRLNLSSVDQYGDTPLHWAARQGRKDIVQYLFECGINPSVFNNSHETPFHQAVRYGHKSVFLDFLAVQDEIVVNSLNNDGEGCIHLAAWYGSTDCMLTLLQSPKIDRNLRNTQQETALHVCGVKGTLACVEALVAGNVNCNLQDHQGWVPVVGALRGLQVDVVDILLPLTNLNFIDYEERSVLYHATEVGNIKAVEYILERCGDLVNKGTTKGVTSLHQASRFGHLDIARMLCSNSADLEMLDADGLSPEVTAMLHGHKPVGEFLRGLGNPALRSRYLHELRSKQGQLSRFVVCILGHPRVGKTSLVKLLQNSTIGSLVRRGSALFRRKSSKKLPPRSSSVSNINQMSHGYPLFTASNLHLSTDLDARILEMSADPLCLQLYDHILNFNTCLYIVVFSLADPVSVQRQQREDCVELVEQSFSISGDQSIQVSFWLRLLSLSSPIEEPVGYCGRSASLPVVLLIGTHADAVKCNKGTAGVLTTPVAHTLLEYMKRHFGYELNILSTIFVVENNNKNSPNIVAINDCILSTGKQLRLGQTYSSDLLVRVCENLPLWRGSKLLLHSHKWTQLLQCEVNPLITRKESRTLAQQLQFMGETVTIGRRDDAEYVIISPQLLFNDLVMPFLCGQIQLKCPRNMFRPRDLHFIFSNYWHDTVEVTEALTVLGMCLYTGSGDGICVEFPALVERAAVPMTQQRDLSLVVRIRIPDFPSYPLLVFPRILVHLKNSLQLCRHLVTLQVLFRAARLGDQITIKWATDEAVEIIASGDKTKNAPIVSDLCAAVSGALRRLLPSALLEETVFWDGQQLIFMQYQDLKTADIPIELVCRICRLLDPKNSMGQDWCLLAVKLNLYDKLLSRFAMLNATVPTESTTYVLLREWTNVSFPQPTVLDLIDGLDKIERQDVVTVVKRFLPVYKFLLGGPFDMSSPSSPYDKTLSSMSSSLLSR